MDKCLKCGKEYQKTGNNQKRCSGCIHSHHKEKCLERHYRTYKKKGYNQSDQSNNNWRGGIGTYRQKVEILKCNRCPSDRNLLVHHKDHNRRNNNLDNLEVLCKKCHQLEHKCWGQLPKGKRLSKLKKIQAKKAKRDSSGKFTK